MNNVRDKKRANKSLPFFFRTEFKVFFAIILVSTILLISTFSFDTVPPILNRGIQPATFPKGLLVLIIALTSITYYLSFKKPWKKEKKLPKPFFLTILSFIIFIISFKNFRFFSSNLSIVNFCFLLLGRKKNFLFITSKYNFSISCLYFF